MPESGYRPSLVTSGLHPDVLTRMGDPHPPMTSFLGVPIISRGKVLGHST